MLESCQRKENIMELFTNTYTVVEDDPDHGTEEIEVTVTNDKAEILDGMYTEVSYWSPRYNKRVSECYDTKDERTYSPESCAIFVAGHEGREGCTYSLKKED